MSASSRQQFSKETRTHCLFRLFLCSWTFSVCVRLIFRQCRCVHEENCGGDVKFSKQANCKHWLFCSKSNVFVSLSEIMTICVTSNNGRILPFKLLGIALFRSLNVTSCAHCLSDLEKTFFWCLAYLPAYMRPFCFCVLLCVGRFVCVCVLLLFDALLFWWMLIGGLQ